mmetsp:Transcript_58473/g.163042  ORF Transcript_58473/g.163042 Transcript_58473/m.163042 type:complete len:353 (+) Transcript_58473:117-1175(+)|eukprot:CAMPEP_0117505574 /NCGR_PEP_ID=MMETSP0784-20121206/25451_1 /TAXON_ID=39447 /ORGANISM="" /LENGTH=352 /DNA_ID=CAMNT_0005300997 /DNA_START=115 /DNA_END=1173 /DNA_ORIENTATION=+
MEEGAEASEESPPPKIAKLDSGSSRLGTPDLDEVRRVAVEAVLEACRLTVRVQSELTNGCIVSKADRSPVTVADFGAQAIVAHRLSVAFPGIPIMGEEDADALRGNGDVADMVLGYVREFIPDMVSARLLTDVDKGRHPGGRGLFWVLDPIDGTKGFLRREQYAVCLGLISDGEVLAAVLGCPKLPVDPQDPESERGCLFVALHGRGAVQHDIATGIERRISVSDVSDPSELCCVESVEKGHVDHNRHAALAKALKFTRRPVRMDSQCKFGVVARGEASLYLRFASRPGGDQNLWDIAAGAKIVEEAGGKVSDANGAPLNYTNGRTLGTGDLFASNGCLHAQVVEALRSASA